MRTYILTRYDSQVGLPVSSCCTNLPLLWLSVSCKMTFPNLVLFLLAVILNALKLMSDITNCAITRFSDTEEVVWVYKDAL